MTRRVRTSAAALIIVLILAMSCTALASAQIRAESKTVYYRSGLKLVVDGRETVPDVTPFIVDPGWIMVPAEFMSKEMGASVTWDDENSTLSITSRVIEAPVPQIHDDGTTKQPANTTDIKGVIAKVSSSVVLIATYDSSGQGLSQGSGVVVGKNMVITNLHVITDASRVVITDASGNTYTCPGVVALDAANDLALLKCDLNATGVALGDSDGIVVGDQVVAIGNPRGLQGTVSDGIVSGRREIDGTNYLQTTAPISPGSSGGGLFAMDCTLIGITTAMIRDSQNLNLAVPSNLVKGLVSAPGPLTAFPQTQETPWSSSTVTYTPPNGDKYEGQVKGGKPHGFGTYRYAEGGTYVGQFDNGVRAGLGTYSWTNGVGQWYKGLREGVGTYTWAGGASYVGQYKANLRHGLGSYIWPNGETYYGEWRNDLKNGTGVSTSLKGEKIVGEYKDDQLHGLAVVQLSDGTLHGSKWSEGRLLSTGNP